jgi:hypothetical protein
MVTFVPPTWYPKVPAETWRPFDTASDEVATDWSAPFPAPYTRLPEVKEVWPVPPRGTGSVPVVSESPMPRDEVAVLTHVEPFQERRLPYKGEEMVPKSALPEPDSSVKRLESSREVSREVEEILLLKESQSDEARKPFVVPLACARETFPFVYVSGPEYVVVAALYTVPLLMPKMPFQVEALTPVPPRDDGRIPVVFARLMFKVEVATHVGTPEVLVVRMLLATDESVFIGDEPEP